MVRGPGAGIMPKNIWPDLITAQRFLSLNTAIVLKKFLLMFNQPAKILQQLKTAFVGLAGDEYHIGQLKKLLLGLRKILIIKGSRKQLKIAHDFGDTKRSS